MMGRKYWTLIASLDQTIGISTILTPEIPEGSPNKVTTAILQTNYALSQWWWVGARAGYTSTSVFGGPAHSNGWLAGASFNYEIWRNLLLTLDYQYTTVDSNVAFSDFTRSVYTAGLTWKY